MAKASKKAAEDSVSLLPTNPTINKPRLHKLIVKNFRCIGPKPVEIELDEIVVLVGPNNAGKSSILKAYEIVMSEGSTNGKLTIEDFPKEEIDENNLPEIELHTILYENTPGDRWITRLDNGDMLIKERWIWNEQGHPKRQGWDVEENHWSDQRPWGAPNIANAGRPEPNLVSAFAPPEKQADEIKGILLKAIEDKIKGLKGEESEELTRYQKLVNEVRELQNEIIGETKDEIDKTNIELSSIISKVFPNYIVDFDPKAVDNVDKAISFSKADSKLLMGPNEGYKSPVELQGSGARRTLLWAALKIISENKRKAKESQTERPHLLLMDEPEICLHPSAIRDACNVLYALPQSGNWQVMVTTHSPIFIDFSRDNTTIVRVERNADGDIEGTTVYKPESTQLSEDDRENLKLLNMCDPYVAEFFFGGKVIIVEGDTEYTAFNYIRSKDPDAYRNVHIIRARGKATIVSLVKILNQFGASYAILHDSDQPRTASGERANPAWGNNENILTTVNAKPEGVATRLVASLPNFEQAYFKEEIDKDKPYHALTALRSDDVKFNRIEKLLQGLIDFDKELPAQCCEWSSIEDLESRLNEALGQSKVETIEQ